MERECARMASADGTTDFYEAVRYMAGITFPSTVVVYRESDECININMNFGWVGSPGRLTLFPIDLKAANRVRDVLAAGRPTLVFLSLRTTRRVSVRMLASDEMPPVLVS